MKLIDADELRKQFSSEEPYGPEEIRGIIDNAPTVEGYKNVIVGGMNNPYNAGYMDGIRQAYKELERPQGKWVKSKDGYTRCDQCGSRGSAIKARFCHHCGADMRSCVK